MRGSKKVLELLNKYMADEFNAIVQYMAQSEMCEGWGYGRLGDLTKKRAIEEMHHAEMLIERIIFLDGIPAVGVALKPNLGTDPKSQLEINLADELQAIKDYNAAIQLCRQEGDDASRALFEKLLHDEERHADFLESQLHAIEEMGYEIYLSQQMKG